MSKKGRTNQLNMLMVRMGITAGGWESLREDGNHLRKIFVEYQDPPSINL